MRRMRGGWEAAAVRSAAAGVRQACVPCTHGLPPLLPARPLPAQGVSLEETRQHVASVVEALRGRPGRKYGELMRAAEG